MLDGWMMLDGEILMAFGWLTQQSSIPVAIVDLMHFISGLTEHNALKFGSNCRANENKTTKQRCENSSYILHPGLVNSPTFTTKINQIYKVGHTTIGYKWIYNPHKWPKING